MFKEFLFQTNHSEKSIISRVNRLKKIETLFQLNVDTIIHNENEVIQLLLQIKEIDTKNQNYANSLRKYYECIMNNQIKNL